MRDKTTFYMTEAARKRARETPPAAGTSGAAADCPACDLTKAIKEQSLKNSQARSKNNE